MLFPLIFDFLLVQGQSSNDGDMAGGQATKKPRLEGGASSKRSDFTPFEYQGSSYTQYTQGIIWSCPVIVM